MLLLDYVAGFSTSSRDAYEAIWPPLLVAAPGTAEHFSKRGGEKRGSKRGSTSDLKWWGGGNWLKRLFPQ